MGRSNSTSDTATVVAAPEQISTTLDEEEVILHLDSNTYFGLNEVGTRIWELVQEPRTVAEVCDAIVTEYDVDPARCESDVRVFLDRLAEADLIERHPDACQS
ncbi:PqqD family protein [Natronococcus pandeyae]|uniref:PqqD family protein n=1 Tax=Natronococcus pandeyae TaxID=2055836 RepID=A0A8J8TQE1_9EURY|nr:PqqD family protein [Natronococcus pandeyae]TYL36442.1 PqqD family protein [Natronococcus pandeyae]